MEDAQLYEMEALETYAAHLDAMCVPDPTATPFYEIMSGGLVWSDERAAKYLPGEINFLRHLWAYRTQLILNNAEPQNVIWEKCVSLFPHWIGFLPERRIATPAILAEYRRGDISSRWCLRKIERNMDAEGK